jgi:hypothetical protein
MSKMSAEKIRRKLDKLFYRYKTWLKAYASCKEESLLDTAKREHLKMTEWEEKLKKYEGE